MKIAVILFNLGGPDGPDAVQPFLFNLFHDKAIIRLPQPLRFFVAKLISSRRAPVAREIYAKIGGGSPIRANTEAQAAALEAKLNEGSAQPQFKCFTAMRYWHPFSDDVARRVADFGADEVVLLPLYPQFSTTTSASSLDAWRRAARKAGFTAPAKTVCCYPQENGFIRALAAASAAAYAAALPYGKPRVLFSAHGLPETIVKSGDPYQWQCGQTVAALTQAMNIPGLDSVLCFQSRVGPLKWIGPATDDEVRRAGADRAPLVIVPIAFVSEHSETLVELDIEYRHLATETGTPYFAYVPTVSVAADFIAGLAALVQTALAQPSAILSGAGGRICPKEFCGCAMEAV
jgi:ferrochelatase